MNAKKIIALVIILIIMAVAVYWVLTGPITRKQEDLPPAVMGGPTASPTPELTTPTPTPTNTMTFEIQGVKVEIIKEGSGDAAKNGDMVYVHYVGTLENGQKFDSSRDRGEPFSFTLGAGQVISGWDLGVAGMKIGEVRRLTIPPALAYGASGIPGAIPANATLIFEVELLVLGQKVNS